MINVMVLLNMDMEDTNVKMIIAVNGVKHVELIDVKKAMFMIQ